MVNEAIAHFGPDDSGRVGLVVRAFQPTYVETTRREALTIPVGTPPRHRRAASLDVVLAVFAGAQWPEYGTVSVVLERGVPIAVERMESRRI